jgi:hypothetical protein
VHLCAASAPWGHEMGQAPSRDIPASRQNALDAFSAALGLLKAAKREPDYWEEECLALALSAMVCGLHDVAVDEIDAFSTAVRQRSPQAIARPTSSPPRFTLTRLRRGLEQVRRNDESAPKARRSSVPAAF